MECDGKCELGKRMSEAKNQHKTGEEITLEDLSLTYTLEKFEGFDLKPIKPTLTIPLIYIHHLLISESDWDFFHPPKAKVPRYAPSRIFLARVGFKFPKSKQSRPCPILISNLKTNWKNFRPFFRFQTYLSIMPRTFHYFKNVKNGRKNSVH